MTLTEAVDKVLKDRTVVTHMTGGTLVYAGDDKHVRHIAEMGTAQVLAADIVANGCLADRWEQDGWTATSITVVNVPL